MARLPHLAAYAVLATAVASAGCGSQTKHAKPLRGWLSYDSSRRTATIRLVPAYNGALGGFNFNGYAKGEVAVVVPLGWKVTVRCENTGQGGRHSCALVRGPGATRPAIVGASSPDPANGLAAGRTAEESGDVAGAVGYYADLLRSPAPAAGRENPSDARDGRD